MAAYAALASLAQTITLDTNHAISHFSIDAKEKIRSIHCYAISLLTFLEECPERSNRWEAKLRDVAHQTEDVIEEFMWRQLYYCYGGEEMPSSLNFEEELRNVTEKFGLITGDVMEERPASPSPSLSSAAEIKDRLCGPPSELQVIPIFGMGGIGKTTLARTVYDDPLIMNHFDIRVWLTISQDCSERKVLLGLIDSMKLINDQTVGLEMDDVSSLKEIMYKHLFGRKYLVVMDDVWSTKIWDDVRYIIPDNGNGSRIMLTTRLTDLADYTCSASAPHGVRLLSETQSWDLLKGKVFEDSNCPPELEDVGKDIARSCRGLPLAILLVAGFLSVVDRNPSTWEEVSENVTNSIVGEGLEAILSLSYTHLPHHLRACFLFMAMFPEDENISAARLIRLWLAGGFLNHQDKSIKSLEEEAEDYLEDLVKRYLVIVTSKKSDGKIKCCSLHDIVRDLCIRKAHDEKFIRVLDDRAIGKGIINEQHITFGQSHMNNIWGPSTRTILNFRFHNLPSLASFSRCCRLLRILDAASETCVSLPSEVFEFFHLRYLALTCSSNIPSAISDLINLQTLIILPASFIVPTFYKWKRYWQSDDNASYHFSLPLEIWKMPQLRHLLLHWPYTLPSPPNGSNTPLENLHTLSYIKNLVWNENILKMIPNIKRLGLVYETNAEFHLSLLKHLDQLEKLKVYGVCGFDWQRQNPNLPSTLKKLTLVGVRLPWEDMRVIGSLPNLQVLKLRDHACRGETWETVDGEFPDLRCLVIEVSRLRLWITESSHFPSLKYLVLRSCPMLREIPEGVGEIPTLELIEVDSSNKSLLELAKQIKEDQERYGNYGLHLQINYSLLATVIHRVLVKKAEDC